MKGFKFDAPHMAVGLDLNSPNNLKYGAIHDGSSARYVRKTGIYTGPGYREVADLATGQPIDDLFGSKNDVFKTLWAKSNTNVYHSVHNVSTGYGVGLSLTASERLFFLEQSNGDVFGFNQTDTPFRLATGVLQATLTDLATGEINVGSGTINKFAASGTVYMNGVSYTYGAKSATSLTGLGGGPLPSGGLPVGTLVTQSSNPATMVDLAGNAVKGTCGMELEGCMLIAGIKGTESIIRISAPSTLDNEEFFYDFQANGASAKVMPNPVTAMIKGVGRGYVFGESYVHAATGFDAASGILLTTPISQDVGAYNPRCVIAVGGKVFFFGKKRFTPINLTLQPDGITSSQIDDNFDYPIQPWLATLDDDQSDSAVLEYDETNGLISITGKVGGSLQTYLYDDTNGIEAYLPRETRPLRCHTFFDGKSYFGSNTTDKVYQNHIGRTNDGIAIAHRWRTGRMETNDRKEGFPDILKFSGYMTSACEFTVNIYASGSSAAVFSEDFDDSIITSSIGRPIGLRGIGSSQVGGDPSAPTLVYPYEVEVELTGIQGYDFEVEWVCNKLGAFLQVNPMLMDGKDSRLASRDRS